MHATHSYSIGLARPTSRWAFLGRLVPRFVVMVAVLAGWVIRAELATLRPIADAELREQQPTGVFGSDLTIVSGGLGFTAGNTARRALIRFEPGAEIPSGATIVSVELGISVTRVPLSPAISIFELKRVRQEWLETEVSWNVRREPGLAWEIPGAGGDEDVQPERSSSTLMQGRGRYTFPSSDRLVADLQMWVDNPGTNHGWLLWSRSENVLQTARHFASRENVADAPELVVEYTVETGIEPPLLSEVRADAGEVEFGFAVEAGVAYTVEYLESVIGMKWTILTNVAAQVSDGQIIIRDNLEAARRFYRVRSP
jgi:hypothetical protein